SAPFAFDQILDMHYYDGFGNEREAYTDYSGSFGDFRGIFAGLREIGSSQRECDDLLTNR
ncbi:MAG: hypothetical protein WBV90_18725, partial [Terrimicrobiaceae bacterium]